MMPVSAMPGALLEDVRRHHPLAEPVLVEAPGGDAAGEAALALLEDEQVPILGQQELRGGQPGLPGGSQVSVEVVQLAMDGDEVLGAHQVQHAPLLRAGRRGRTRAPRAPGPGRRRGRRARGAGR